MKKIFLFVLISGFLVFGCSEGNKSSEGDLPEHSTLLPDNFESLVDLDLDKTSLGTGGTGSLVFKVDPSYTMTASDIEGLNKLGYVMSPNGKIESVTYANNILTFNFSNVLFNASANGINYKLSFSDNGGKNFELNLFRVTEYSTSISNTTFIFNGSSVALNAERSFGFFFAEVSGGMDDNNTQNNDIYGADGVATDKYDLFGRCNSNTGFEIKCVHNGHLLNPPILITQGDINGSLTESDGLSYFLDGFPGNSILAFYTNDEISSITNKMSGYDNTFLLDGANSKITMNEALTSSLMSPSLGQVFYVGDGHPDNGGSLADTSTANNIQNNRTKLDKYVFKIPVGVKNIKFGIEDNDLNNNLGDFIVKVGLIQSM